jgi:hypothetical protein
VEDVTMKKSSAKDSRPPVVLPPDARAALVASPTARAAWDRLAYTHRKEHAAAITEAKKPETRARRIARMVHMLDSGRPSLSNTVSARPTVAKMGITSGQRVLVLDADAEAMKIWKLLPAGCALDTRADRGCGDVVVLYAATAAHLKKRLRTAMRAVEDGGVLWVAYLKQSSGRATTLTRDMGWEPVEAASLRSVTMIALDDDWAGTKYRLPKTWGHRDS